VLGAPVAQQQGAGHSHQQQLVWDVEDDLQLHNLEDMLPDRGGQEHLESPGDFDSDLEGVDVGGAGSPANQNQQQQQPPSAAATRGNRQVTGRQPDTRQHAAGKESGGRQRKAPKNNVQEPEVDPASMVALGRGVSSRADELAALLAAAQTTPASAAVGQRLLRDLRERLTAEQRRLVRCVGLVGRVGGWWQEGARVTTRTQLLPVLAVDGCMC
jgi:hypothetical protein